MKDQHKEGCSCDCHTKMAAGECWKCRIQHKEEWEGRLMDEFCVMFERATADSDEPWVQRLESFIAKEKQKSYEQGRNDAVDYIKNKTKGKGGMQKYLREISEDTLKEARNKNL